MYSSIALRYSLYESNNFLVFREPWEYFKLHLNNRDLFPERREDCADIPLSAVQWDGIYQIFHLLNQTFGFPAYVNLRKWPHPFRRITFRGLESLFFGWISFYSIGFHGNYPSNAIGSCLELIVWTLTGIVLKILYYVQYGVVDYTLNM